MIDAITIQRKVEQYKDIFAVVEYYMPKYGTAVNTAAVLIRESLPYLEWQKTQTQNEPPVKGQARRPVD